MDDNSKTIAQILKEIDDKTADRSEVLPLLKNIERNTSKATATAMGSAVEKAMVKATARSEKRQRTSTAGKRQQQASTAIVTSSKKNSSSPGREHSGPVLVHTRDKAGRFVAKAPGSTRNIAAEQKQDAQNDKLSSILKDAVMQKKDTIKNTAGKLAFGPFWDIGKELKEAADAMKDNAKDEKGTIGRLKNWGKGTRLGKAAGNAKDRVVAKYQDRKAAKAGTATAAGATVVNNGGNSPGVLERAQQIKDLKDSFKGRKGVKVSRAGSVGRGAAGAARGGGMMARGAGAAGGMLSSVGRMIGPLLSGISLPLVAAAGAAAFGVWQFTKALTTGESDVYNWFKKITGYDPSKETQADRDKAAKVDQQNLDELNRQRAANGQSAVDAKGRYKTEGNVVFANGKTTTVKNADGSLTEQKGTRAARNNNAGNIEYGDFAKANGATGSDGRFAVFPTKEAGDKAKEKLFFEGKNYKNKTLAEATARWAPSSENDTAKYAQVLTKAAGGQNKKMSEYTPEQRKAIMAAMEKHEGNKLESKRIIPASEAEAYLASKNNGTPVPAAAAQPAKPQQQATGGGQKASGAGPASSQVVPNAETGGKPVVAKSKGKSSKSNKKKTTGQPATAPATAPAAPAETTAAVEGQTQKATEATQQPVVATGTAVKAGSQVLTAKPDYAAMTQAMFNKDNQPEGAAAATAPPVATATGTVVKKEEPSKFSKEQADSEYATAESEKKAALDAHWSKYRPQIDAMEKSGDISGATKLAKEANAIQGDIYADYNKKTDAIRAKEAAAKDTTATGTVVKKEEPPQPGQPATATALPPATPATDPSVVTGTATMSPKQYGAGDIFNERKSIDEASKQKKAKMLSDFRSGKTTEDEYIKAAAEEDKARQEKKASLAELSKKAEGGQFVSQAEMDKATGKVSAQPDKVNALSSAQPPLPEVKPVQAPPPPPVEVPGLEKLAKANEQQAAQQNSGADKAGGKPGIPNIKTDFDDTMLVLMSYDRI